MKLTKKSDVQFIFDAIEDINIELINENNKYIAKLSLPIEKSNDDISFMLTEFMRFEISEDEIFYLLSNADNKVIQYDNESVAMGVAEAIKRNFGRQISFSIFRKTGLKFLPKNKSSDNIPIKFIEIK